MSRKTGIVTSFSYHGIFRRDFSLYHGISEQNQLIIHNKCQSIKTGRKIGKCEKPESSGAGKHDIRKAFN